MILRLTQTINLIGCLGSLGILIYATDFFEKADFGALEKEPALAFFFLLLLLWIVSPFGCVSLFAPRLSSSKVASWLFLLAVFILVALTLYLYWDIFVARTNPDPQNGLILFSLPFFQLLGFFVTAPICFFIRERFPAGRSPIIGQ